jgi:hypothetical protein
VPASPPPDALFEKSQQGRIQLSFQLALPCHTRAATHVPTHVPPTRPFTG